MYRAGVPERRAWRINLSLSCCRVPTICFPPWAPHGNPLTAPDSQVAEFADNYFEYSGSGVVSTEIVNGGELTISYAYQQSGNPQGYNIWATKTVETRPDGSQNIVYCNYAGQTMLRVLLDNGQEWCDFYQYSDDGLMILHASPSAVSGYGEQFVDLLNNLNGQYQYSTGISGTTGLRSSRTDSRAAAGHRPRCKQ